MTDRISIIITSYNYAPYLGEAIASALAQDWPELEVIVIDDGSRDDSVAIACGFPVTVLVQENQGVSAARNNAAGFATGQYMLFLDADDILPPDALRRLHARLVAGGEQVAYAYGPMTYFGFREGLFPSRPFDAAALVKENFICATTLIRRDLFLALGGYDRALERWEDWDLYLHFLDAGYGGAFEPQSILHYRKHKDRVHIRLNTAKNIARSKLLWKYPRFFWRTWLRNPVKWVYYALRYRVAENCRWYGPVAARLPRVLQDQRRPA